MQIPMEFVGDRANSGSFPDFLDVVAAETAPPSHNQAENTCRPGRLTNGVKIIVPPFVKTGDRIRVNVSELKYMDRAKGT